MSNPKWWGSLCLASSASIWGGMYVVSKYVLDYIPPFTLLWLRYAIALLALGLFLGFKDQRKISQSDLPSLILIGFVGYFVSIGSQFVGTSLSTAHMGAIITSASPAFIVVFAYWLLNEKFTMNKGVAILIASVGVVIAIGLGEGREESSFMGNLVLLLAAVTWALYSVFVKIASIRLSSLQITTYAIGVALVFTGAAVVSFQRTLLETISGSRKDGR